jgi:hypothetical protein
MKPVQERRSWDNSTLEPILKKLSTIASGDTPIGSTGRAPDEELLQEEQGRKIRVHCWCQAPENKLDISLPSGEICD